MKEGIAERDSALGALCAIYSVMSPSRRKHLALAIALMLIGAFAELLTISAVLPFLAVIADPDHTRPLPSIAVELRALAQRAGGDLVATAALFLVIVAFATAVIRLLLAWVSQNFVFRLGHEIGLEIYSRMLRQPYSYHVMRNTSEVIAGIEKVQVIVTSVLLPLMQAVTAGILSVFIIGILFAIDPLPASAAAVSMMLVYVGVSFATRRILKRNAKLVAAVQTQRVKQIQEGLGGVRDILIDHSQPVFESEFRRLDSGFRRAQAVNTFVGAAPRFIVESAGIALIALLAMYLSRQPGGIIAAIPVLGALALGAQRLLPLLQMVYLGWSQFTANRQNLIDTVKLMQAPVAHIARRDQSKPPRIFQENVIFDQVSFSYPSGPPVLKDITLRIERGERIGLIGETGSGKSTLLDLLMGLLEPTGGRILIDGQLLDDASRTEWQGQIAHVPQSIYLSDNSVAANIAFGQAKEEIDFQRVREAGTQAEIDAFISSLPEGYDTIVGERGIRLSGGQRQRIGIARALYKRAKVLILDEATSALDDETEASIVNTVSSLGPELTIIMIAHRLTTLAGCDRIVRMKDGRILEMGNYAEITAHLPAHRSPIGNIHAKS